MRTSSPRRTSLSPLLAAFAAALIGCDGAGGVGAGPPDAAPDAHLESWECPPGEQCVDNQAYLYNLFGTSTSDTHLPWTPFDTAVGGVQTYHVVYTGRPFDDFEVDSSDTVANLLSLAPPDIVTQAAEAGEGTIRLLHPESGLLYNRFDVRARPAAFVAVGARTEISSVFWNPGSDWVFVSGRPGQVVIGLHSVESHRLVDQRLTIAAAPGETALVEQLVWDRAEVTPPVGSASVRLSVGVGDGTVLAATVPVVDETAVNLIDLTGYGNEFPPLYTTWGSWAFCFDVYAFGRRVMNLPIVISTDPSLNPTPYEFSHSSALCIYLTPDTPGLYLLTAQAGPFTMEYDVLVVE